MLFQCRIKNSINELPCILDGLEAIGLDLAWEPAFQMQLTLVVEELVVNAIHYGGCLTDQGWVEVRVESATGGVNTTIEDNGLAFDPFSAPQPDMELDLDNRNAGGLGVHFVRELTERYGYERDGEINRVVLFKRFDSGV
jgi:serine/threonine-protein kinase RsbW